MVPLGFPPMRFPRPKRFGSENGLLDCEQFRQEDSTTLLRLNRKVNKNIASEVSLRKAIRSSRCLTPGPLSSISLKKEIKWTPYFMRKRTLF